MPVFVIAFTAIYFAMHLFVAVWLARHFPQALTLSKTLWAIIIASSSLVPLYMGLARHYDFCFAREISFIVYSIFGSVFILFSVLVLADAAEFVLKFFLPFEKYCLISGFGAAAVALILIIGGIINCAREPVIRQIEIPVKNLPPAAANFSILQLSDTHLSLIASVGRLKTAMDKAMALKPDLIVHTGDFADESFRDDKKLIAYFGTINPPMGKIAVLGNHEIYHGTDASIKRFEDCGFRILSNGRITLDNGVQIAGVGDIRTIGISRETIGKVLNAADKNKPLVFLSHQPLYFETAAKYANLMLSGHTHWGQIFPFNFLVKIFYRRDRGLYRNGDSFLYVSPGTFFWGPPMRVFTRNEITLFRLVPSK